jgi:hypothetical protein
MNVDDLKSLLRQSLPPVDAAAEPERDLWPELQRRIYAKPVAVPAHLNWAWLDGALAVGVVGLAAFFPAAIPVLLYYL